MTQKKNLIRGILVVVPMMMAFLATDCKHAPTEPTTPSFAVTDVNCTEAWLHVTYSSARNTTVILKRNDAAIDTFLLTTSDTTFADTGLAPAHTYQYTALLDNKTETATATTMDTSSSNFTFQTFTLGGAASSMLSDVAIINDTLAYAVGLIYGYDSTGQVDQQPYNLAIWNGQSWKIQKVPYYYQGQAFYGPIYSMCVFNSNDIWFGIGNMVHWDGVNFNAVDISSVWGSHRIEKIWGTSSSNFYIVGDGGSIAHYNGSSWTKIASGATLDIRDIWGVQNTKTGSLEIYATAGNPLISPDNGIIQISGTTAQAISTVGIGGGLNGIWFSPGHYYWIVGDGEWEKHPTLADAIWHMQALSSYTIDAVRGTGINNAVMCGAYGEVLHFNGVSWKSYQSQTGIPGAYLGLAVRGNTVIAVGEEPPYAVVPIGKQN